MGLENVLCDFGRFNRKLITSSLLGLSLISGCSGGSDGKPAPTSPGPTTTPTTPTTPTQNIPPTILSNPVTQVNENVYYQYEVQAKSNSANPLNYSVVQGPVWLEAMSNFISGRVPEVYENTTFPVKIKISDGVSSVEQAYNLNVTNISDTRVLNLTQIGQLTNVSTNSMSFSQPVNFVAKDIIGAGISSQTPEGILREVTSVSPDKKTVYTTQATLEQTVSKASLSFSRSLYPSSIISSRLVEGASMAQANAVGFNFSVDLNNVVLYDRDGNLNTKGDQLTANGNVSFNTDFSLNVDIENFALKYLRFQNISSERAEISVGSNLAGIASYKEIKIAEYKFQPFVIGYVPTPIPLPVVVTPKIGIYMGINPTFVNPLAVRVTQEASLDTKIIYSGGWTGSANFSNNFNFSNPIFTGEWDLNVSTGPKLELLLYGVLGPTVSVNAGLRLAAKGEDYSLYGKLDAGLGISMNIFSKKISSNFEKVIEYEKLLARNERPGAPVNSFTDTRDGRVYKTTQISNQIWMAENLNYNHANSRFYNNVASNGTIYGRLYGKVGAEESCPSGWKLPSSSEWDILFNSLGGRNTYGSGATGGKMKSTGTVEAGTGLWRSPNTGATNESGFAAIPGGMAENNATVSYTNMGYRSYFWVSTSAGAQANILLYDTGGANSSVAYGNNFQNIPLFSVRCLKN